MMKMSRSLMGNPLSEAAVLQCGIHLRIAQISWKIVLGLSSVVGAAQVAEQPGARIGPEEIRAARGDAEDGRGLGNAQAGEVAELDQFGCLGIGGGQPRQRGVDFQHIVEAFGSGGGELVEVQANAIAAALPAPLPARIIDEDAAHGLRGSSEEVARLFQWTSGAPPTRRR